MDTRFADIKVLLWDFDKTLYRPHSDLERVIRQAEFQVIIEHTGWTQEKTEEEFAKLLHAVTHSGTEVTATLAGISIPEAAVEIENLFDRRDYLGSDEQVAYLFDELPHFRHIIIANGIKKNVEDALECIGVSPKTFELIVTSEQTGTTKPHDAPFQLVLDHTKLPAPQHMMIGDRPAVDLMPAKKFGMHTCLVLWHRVPSEAEEASADICVPTVYDVSTILV